MAWWNFWKRPKSTMTPEEEQAVAEIRQAVQDVREYIDWLRKLPRPVLEAWRDQLAKEEKARNP